jgi:hypothetical protein
MWQSDKERGEERLFPFFIGAAREDRQDCGGVFMEGSMPTVLQDLTRRAREIEAEFETELARRRELLGGRLVRGRMMFETEVLARHRAARENLLEYTRAIPLRHMATAPMIYSLILPLALVDLWITLYQWSCFPAYRIPACAGAISW